MSGPGLCGSTNALTSLQKHTFQDRQLQQDRLRSQAAGPSSFQNFRANTNLNSEFDQFASAPSPFALAPAPAPAPTANWAADFQRLHISQPPQPQSSFQHRPAPLVPRSTPWGQQQNGANWAAEFMRSQSAAPVAAPVMAAPIHHQQQQQQTQFTSSQFASVGGMYTTESTQYEGLGSYYGMMSEGGQGYETESMWASSSSMAPMASTTQQFQPVAADQVSDAAFDAAFAEAYRWTLESTQQDELDAISAATPKLDKGKGREIVVDTPVPQPFHADPVEEEKADGEQIDRDDSDELSKTAGQLLDSLATNQSEKFQQSNFLALMRKLRDKEVKVEGEKMVEVNASG